MEKREEYPANLLNSIEPDWISQKDLDNNNYTADQIKGLDWVLEEYLTQCEMHVIRALYRNHLSVDTTGEMFNVTAECIRQIEKKAIRKLSRKPRAWRYVRQGYDASTEKLRRLIDKNEKRLRGVFQEEGLEKLYDGPIESLDWTLRTRVCSRLKRAGVHDVRTLLCLVQWDRWWIKFRNVGPLCDEAAWYILQVNGLIPFGSRSLVLPYEEYTDLEHTNTALAHLYSLFAVERSFY